jgi:hypothetical protein
MQRTPSTGTPPAETPDLVPAVVNPRLRRGYRSTPDASCDFDEPDFAEGHEDPAQSEELERQQDA